MLSDVLSATASQKVLQFLAKHPDKDFHEREIARRTGIAAGSANRASKDLYDAGVLRRRRQGKMVMYSIDSSHPAVVHVKILSSIALVEALVETLKSITSRIVLFGSCAQGTDTSESDVDLFIVTRDRESVLRAIDAFQFPIGFEGTRIQAIIKTPAELLQADASEHAFLSEVEQGITLWPGGMNER